MMLLAAGASAILLTFLGLATAAPAPTLDDDHSQANAPHRLVEEYNATNWFAKFDVQAIDDPTHGFVNYLSQKDAQSSGLYRQMGGQIYMGVDNTTMLDTNAKGRSSVRLQSKNAYHHALVVADIAHMPDSTCGSWPAFWMVGPNWPYDGEIDIIEGVNTMSTNQATLHTSSGCVPAAVAQTGQKVGASDCGADQGYIGCGVTGGTYGSAFNDQDGGVFAMLWTSSGISVWAFRRNAVPQDISAGAAPNPSRWGPPIAGWTGCDFDKHFNDLHLVFDTTFCGDWSGSAWSQTGCAAKSTSCTNFVASTPGAFSQAYWLVNSVKVYGA